MSIENIRKDIVSFIAASSLNETGISERKNNLFLKLAKWQAENVPGYSRYCKSLKINWSQIEQSSQIPALPTDVFRFQRLAAFEQAEGIKIFKTSGTTNLNNPGVHEFRNLEVYDLAAKRGASYGLFPDMKKMHLIMLAPHEEESPHSSLSYMLTRFSEWFESSRTSWIWKNGKLSIQSLIEELGEVQKQNIPVAILGTSFAFVHAEDALKQIRFHLPIGSRLMQTGGYKGKSRTIEPSELRKMLSDRYGVECKWITSEYGMTELSSQMYEHTLQDALSNKTKIRRSLWVPPWVNLSLINPQTLLPIEQGEIGIVRIEDLANIDSICAIQTSDMGKYTEDGIELIGRFPGSTHRGCSIAADTLLMST